jgi:hypothetical protein
VNHLQGNIAPSSARRKSWHPCAAGTVLEKELHDGSVAMLDGHPHCKILISM